MNTENPYHGVNPHLNSFLQSPGGAWEAFHTSAIERLVENLEAHLPPNYYALSETSLQISTRIADDAPLSKPKKTIPDVAVYHTSYSTALKPKLGASIPTLTLPVTDAFDEEAYATAVVIYHFDIGDLPGQPVTRLEVLSPANKPNGSYYGQYMTKRREALKSGLRLVEIDLLHETRPLIRTMPSYIDGDESAYPYTIIVNDPRPTLEQGKTELYGFSVREMFPVVNIPLDDLDQISVDFGLIYNLTVKSRRLFQMVIDYTQKPARFHTYSTADQKFIEQRMVEIATR